MCSVIGSGIVIFGLYIFLLGKVRQMKEECEKKLPSHFGQEESQDDEHYKKGHLMVVPMTPWYICSDSFCSSLYTICWK